MSALTGAVDWEQVARAVDWKQVVEIQTGYLRVSMERMAQLDPALSRDQPLGDDDGTSAALRQADKAA